MKEQFYDVYYGDGLKEGVQESDVLMALAQSATQLSETEAKIIICNPNRTIKSNLDKAQAEHYFNTLNNIGLQVEIRQLDSDGTYKALDPSMTIGQSFPIEPDVASSQKESVRDIPVEFHGKSFEYFKIWIVNLVLTIFTLGIYSAWAKVRNTQYFYGNTLIDGSSFQYTASPIQILKGRIVAVLLLLAYVIIEALSPILAGVLAIIFLLFLPWIVMRSLAFNAHNSMYRNIRFRFTGGLFDTVITFLVLPILAVLTLGLLLPYLWYKQISFIVGNHSFGSTPFKFHSSPMAYYKIFMIFILACGVVGAIFMYFFSSIFTTLIMGLAAGSGEITQIASGLALMLLLFIIYQALFAYLKAALGNLFFNDSTLSNNSFTSTLQTRGLTWLYVTNTIGIVCSLGLLIPWARVRTATYRAKCLTLHVKTSLDSFIAGEEKKVSALGEEVGEAFSVDMGAGI